MIETSEFYSNLIKRQLDFFVGVPDSLLKEICAFITDKTAPSQNIIAANEGSAIGISTGYHLATRKYGVVYLQNSGLGNAVNPLLSLADPAVYSIPMLLLIGWRGEPGIKDEPQHEKQGSITPALLDTLGIKYLILEDDYQKQLDYCLNYLQTQQRPIALLVKKNSFTEYKMNKSINNYPLSREKALEIILSQLTDEDFVVSTTGKTSREIFELREKLGQGHQHDFLTVGSMGHSSAIAFGITLGSSKPVYCIDGDGALIMHMGNLAVIANNHTPNFKYILINNGAHESVGGQPTVAFNLDLEKVLTGLGFDQVITVENEETLKEALKIFKSSTLNALIINTRQGSRSDLGRPTISPQNNKTLFMEKLADKT